MNNIFIYIAYIAGTLFVAMGVAVLLTDWVPDYYSTYKIILAVVLILYGFYRFLIAYTKQKNAKQGGE
jgi:hypothetical protein